MENRIDCPYVQFMNRFYLALLVVVFPPVFTFFLLMLPAVRMVFSSVTLAPRAREYLKRRLKELVPI